MAKTQPKAHDPFGEENEVKSNWVKWGNPGEDKVWGTLISKKTVKSTFPGKENEDVNIYELKADYGSFHATDGKKVAEEETVLGEGEIWSIGGKPMIDRQMTNIKIGQKIGMKYIEDKPAKTKGFADSKIIKVFTQGEMDEEWLAEKTAENDLIKGF
jgi:hypothetical protein